MQAGVPAKKLRERGSPHAKLQTQEAAEETQWSFFCRADIFALLAARIGPAVFVPQQSALAALIDCFGPGQKLKWKTLQRDRMRESRALRSRNATTNEAGDEQERVAACCR